MKKNVIIGQGRNTKLPQIEKEIEKKIEYLQIKKLVEHANVSSFNNASEFTSTPVMVIRYRL